MFVPEHIRKISYASSFGVSNIPWYQRKRTAQFLKRLDYISMREIRGSEIVKELTGREVPTILDPVFSFNKDEWNQLIPQKKLYDGILTSLKMMEVMQAKKKPMSELAAPLKIYPQVLENVRVTDKKAAQNDPAVQEAVSKVAEALGDTGRILVRESGTEPVVRVMVEAPDHNTCQKYVDEVVNVICEKGYKA